MEKLSEGIYTVRVAVRFYAYLKRAQLGNSQGDV